MASPSRESMICCAVAYRASHSTRSSTLRLPLGVVFALNWIVWGGALTIVCLAAALYFGFGHLFPGVMRDLALDPGVIVSNLAGMGSPRGLFMYVPLSADTILLLLVYGGLMSGTKVLDMFAELGNAIGNYLRGGVAYSCIAASSLIGMVTGQTVSCIALTGSVTIPTMIRGGFRKEEAGAIERCVDSLIETASVSSREVDRVFLTGGSSFVPAIRRIFEARFGADRVRSGDEFTSVARGLALRAAEAG